MYVSASVAHGDIKYKKLWWTDSVHMCVICDVTLFVHAFLDSLIRWLSKRQCFALFIISSIRHRFNNALRASAGGVCVAL
jgi:hypothetical protein